MEGHKLSFANENFVVDYISFNRSGLRDAKPIGNYLVNFGFNSRIAIENRSSVTLLVQVRVLIY